VDKDITGDVVMCATRKGVEKYLGVLRDIFPLFSSGIHSYQHRLEEVWMISNFVNVTLYNDY
jgi:hypothetical protein